MGWFPLRVDDSAVVWSFDIVGLLAVVGGSSIAKHAQTITASPLGCVPRLLPAPETMLETDRPVRLPSIKGVDVVGVHSGNRFNELNFFADVIHGIESLKQYEFQSFRISHWDLEQNGGSKQKKGSENEAIIPLKTFCPLNLLTMASILMTIALFIWSAVQHNAVALLGLGTMSLSTSTACLSARWRPKLTIRKIKTDEIPPGDVVIRSRAGAFVSIKCTEEVARELYAGTEVCDYVFEGRQHQCLLAASSVLLMAAIIFFSNCGWKVQIAVGLAYIILNLAYWALALLTEPGEIWDIDSRYNVVPIHEENKTYGNYTQVLWRAIQDTGDIGWVKNAGMAPSTKNWAGWLDEAKENCHNPKWDCELARDQWMAKKL